MEKKALKIFGGICLTFALVILLPFVDNMNIFILISIIIVLITSMILICV